MAPAREPFPMGRVGARGSSPVKFQTVSENFPEGVFWVEARREEEGTKVREETEETEGREPMWYRTVDVWRDMRKMEAAYAVTAVAPEGETARDGGSGTSEGSVPAGVARWIGILAARRRGSL